jgi:hypothetical protein
VSLCINCEASFLELSGILVLVLVLGMEPRAKQALYASLPPELSKLLMPQCTLFIIVVIWVFPLCHRYKEALNEYVCFLKSWWLFYFYVFTFWWDWGLNSGLCAQSPEHKVLWLEPHLQSILLWLSWRWGLKNCFPRLTNLSPPPPPSQPPKHVGL